jgi:hypothetical protein
MMGRNVAQHLRCGREHPPESSRAGHFCSCHLADLGRALPCPHVQLAPVSVTSTPTSAHPGDIPCAAPSLLSSAGSPWRARVAACHGSLQQGDCRNDARRACFRPPCMRVSMNLDSSSTPLGARPRPSRRAGHMASSGRLDLPRLATGRQAPLRKASLWCSTSRRPDEQAVNFARLGRRESHTRMNAAPAPQYRLLRRPQPGCAANIPRSR